MIVIKKKIFAVALIICCLAIATYGTVAYFTAEGTARNVITSGKVNVTIEEWHETEGELIAYPYAEGLDVMPGRVVSKIVTVMNESASAYVRARYTVEITDKNGNIMEHTPEELEALVIISDADEKWTYNDGWYYYTDALDKGASTQPLFETVEFSGVNMTNEYQGCSIRIIVEAEGVQSAHNGDDVLKAAGWEE